VRQVSRRRVHRLADRRLQEGRWLDRGSIGWLAWCCTNSDTGNYLMVETNFQIWWAPGCWWHENLDVYWYWGVNAWCDMAWWQGYATCHPVSDYGSADGAHRMDRDAGGLGAALVGGLAKVAAQAT
jgi:hypothetical protein